eukprot:jgi/Hompol1/4845/HPOL_004002-RA
MPPKKAQEKQKARVIEDKTFGLKNKNKSSKVKQYVEQVTHQVQQSGNRKERELAEQRKKEQEAKKRSEEQRKAELAELFKPIVQQQKVPFGVDPKTVLCAYFKAGQCQKGTKCKFSHDLNIERKSLKADLYTDVREKPEDNMEDWDQKKLEDAVRQKHTEKDNANKPTDIVCKYFIEAIETRKYGWFWECPNGGSKCKYRHALPPGFVLKKKETEEERRAREEEEKENQITIEDFLETERHNLGSDLTPVTSETFAKWKADRKERERRDQEELLKSRMEEFKKMKAGMKTGMTFSGRELFDFNPEYARNDADDAGAMDEYLREDGASDAESDGGAGAGEQFRNSAYADGSLDQDTVHLEDIGDDDGEYELDRSAGPSRVRVDEDLFANEDLGDDDDDDEEEQEEEEEDGDGDAFAVYEFGANVTRNSKSEQSLPIAPYIPQLGGSLNPTRLDSLDSLTPAHPSHSLAHTKTQSPSPAKSSLFTSHSEPVLNSAVSSSSTRKQQQQQRQPLLAEQEQQRELSARSPPITPLQKQFSRIIDDFRPSHFYIENIVRAAFNRIKMATAAPQPSLDALTVLYASQTGNAESIAKHIHEEALLRGFDSSCFVADDVEKVDWNTASVVVVVTSTTGDGDHPDNSIKFWKWLRRGKNPDPAVVLKGRAYTILGLGDTNYTNFNQPAKRLDRRLVELGAKSILAKGLADEATGLEATVDPWIVKLWATLEQFVKRDAVKAQAFAAREAADGARLKLGLGLGLGQGSGSKSTDSAGSSVAAQSDSAAPAPASAPASASVDIEMPQAASTLPAPLADLPVSAPVSAPAPAPAPAPAATPMDLDSVGAASYADCYAPHPLHFADLAALENATQLTGIPKLPAQFIDVTATGLTRAQTSIFSLLQTPVAPPPPSPSSLALLDPSSSSESIAVPATADAPVYSANAPFAAKIASVRCLSGSRALEKILELELDVAASSYTYLPGDAFGILAPNPKELVTGITERLGLAAGDHVVDILPKTASSTSGLPFTTAIQPTYAEILTHFLELHALPKRAFFRVLADHTTDPAEKKLLLFLSSTQGAEAYRQLRAQQPTLLDILSTFPSCTPPFSALIENLPRLQPRYYSVACAPTTHPGRVRFAFNVVAYRTLVTLGSTTISKPVKGLCSSWLDTLVSSVSQSSASVDISALNIVVPFFPRAISSTGFHLPRDVLGLTDAASTLPTHIPTPLVLIAAGTGISPFISFLEALKAERSMGRDPQRTVWLIYGHRFGGPTGDGLYDQEIRSYVESGVITRYIECLSREPAASEPHPSQPKYVQDAIHQHKETLWDLMELSDASFYVCGSLAVGKSVNDTLAHIAMTHKFGMENIEQALKYLSDKTFAKKYLKDIWG